MTEDQIKHMVCRFLTWKLPEDFRPDGGVSFDAVGNRGSGHEHRREPVGTNLFDYEQAEAMVRYMLEGLPPAPSDNLVTMADLRNDGTLLTPEVALLDSAQDLRTGRRKAAKVLILFLDEENGSYCFGFSQAGMKCSEMITLCEVAKAQFLNMMGFS